MSNKYWLAPPEWANCKVYFQNEDPLLKTIVEAQRQPIMQEAWKIFWSQEGLSHKGGYFIGRQSFEWTKEFPDHIWIDAEICHLCMCTTHPLKVNRRYLLPLLWNPATQQARVMLGHPRKQESVLTQLNLCLITPMLHQMDNYSRVEDQAELEQLSRHWNEIVKCCRQASEEFFQEWSTPGGDFTDIGWPDRIEMTGEYSMEVRQMTDQEQLRFWASLYFRGQPSHEDSRLWNEAGLDFILEQQADGQWICELQT